MTRFDLGGRVILITRPEPEAEITAQQVAAHHGIPWVVPLLKIVPPMDLEPLHHAMAQVGSYDGLMVTSINGARALLASLPDSSLLPPVYTVGPKTAHFLEQAGIRAISPATEFHGMALAEKIFQVTPLPQRLLLLQAEQGRDALVARLEERGCRVERVVAYRAEPVESLPSEVLQALSQKKIDAVTFFSSKTADSFLDALPQSALSWLRETVIAAISQATAESLQARQIQVDVVAGTATGEALLEALARYWQTDHPSLTVTIQDGCFPS